MASADFLHPVATVLDNGDNGDLLPCRCVSDDLQLPLAELELLPVGQASEAAAGAAAETPELSDGLFLLACSSALALVYFFLLDEEGILLAVRLWRRRPKLCKGIEKLARPSLFRHFLQHQQYLEIGQCLGDCLKKEKQQLQQGGAQCPPPSEQPDEDEVRDRRLCVVCLSAERSVALLPCAHANMCADCPDRLPGNRCPTCRAVVFRVLKLYDQ